MGSTFISLPVVLDCLDHLHLHFHLALQVPLVILWALAFLALPCCHLARAGQEHPEYQMGPAFEGRQLLLMYIDLLTSTAVSDIYTVNNY